MTEHLCDPEGFRITLNEGYNKEGDDAIYRFYQENRNFDLGRTVWRTQFADFANRWVEDVDRCLEIGYGLGNILSFAAKDFNRAIGIDVHDLRKTRLEDLARRGCFNVELKQTNGSEIPYPSSVVSFVYSWTVFMHMGSADIVEKYMAEIQRVLKPGGVALIYFARPVRSDHNQTKQEWKEDIELEADSNMGVVEEPGRKCNQINLRIPMYWMEELAEKCGLEVVERTASKRPIHGIKYYHGQHGIGVRK